LRQPIVVAKPVRHENPARETLLRVVYQLYRD
jgi:hypothetical protein